MKRLSEGLVFSGALIALIGIGQFILQFFIGINSLYNFWAEHVAALFLGKTFSQSVLEHPSWLVNISGHTYFRAISIFPDPHMLSLFLGLLLPIAVVFFLERKKNLWLFCALVIFLADILTFSRGGYLGLAGALVVLFFIFQKKIVRKYKIIFFAGLFFLIATLIIPNPIATRFFSSFNLEEGSNAGRLVMWNEAVKNISTHPLIGVGLGNFPLSVNPLADYREPIYAHNTYLDIAVESGIPAALFWTGFLLLAIITFLKKIKIDRFYLGLTLSLVIFAVHSIVEMGLYSPVVLTLLLIIAAFSTIQEKNEKIF